MPETELRTPGDLVDVPLTLLATRIVGDAAYSAMIRRLAFVVASGNNDAHMKNWSIVYQDGVTAVLSPLYDQVFTAQWPSFSVQMALELGGTKEFAAVDVVRFRELARRIGRDLDETSATVLRTIEEVAAAWGRICDDPTVTPAYRSALQRHWRKVPLLQPHALLI